MASDKLRRENVTDQRNIEVEKDRVPKMTTHFESLAVKAKGDEVPLPHGGDERETVAVKATVHGGEGRGREVYEEKPRQVGSGMEGIESQKERNEMEKRGAQMPTAREGGGRREEVQEKAGRGKGGGGGEGSQEVSLEEMSNLRGKAQQNSMEAIRAAEERYEKAKELGATELQKAKETAAEKGGALKDTALEKGQQGYVTAKDTLKSAGKTAADYTMQAKDYTAQKAMEAKDVVAEKGQTTAQYAAERAKEAKDTTVDKAATAKDVTVETGKGVTGYAGKVAGVVKEKAVVAGWGAAHYTAEAAAVATKKVVGVTSSVAGYTGEKVAGATHTVAGYAGDKLAAAKDVVVSSEEKAAEYAARKKAEAEKELEAKQPQHQEGERGSMEKHDRGGEKKQAEYRPTEKIQEYFQGQKQTESRPSEKNQGYVQGEGGEKMQQEKGSVLQAIGETIVEIGQTTKDLLVGQAPTQGYHKDDEAKEVDEPHRGAGEGI